VTLKLQKFSPVWGVPDPSPFCVKLESFLKLNNIPYDPLPFDPKTSFKQAPKGKIPYVIFEDGRIMGDSTMIINYLCEVHNIDMDAPLSAEQRATSFACRRMLDEHFYWAGLYSRWLDEPGWHHTKEILFGSIPSFVRGPVSSFMRKGVRASARGQGMARHSREEVYARAEKDMGALSVILDKDAYFFQAQQPTLLDLWTHAFMINVIRPPIDSPLKDAALRHSNLCDHADRLHNLIYTETQADRKSAQAA
jgi:glutathione S-transferase